MSKANKVGAAWVKEIETKNGKQKILSLTIGEKRYALFKNGFKEQPKHPDYVVYEDNYEPKQEQPKPEPKPEPKEFNDDLPF